MSKKQVVSGILLIDKPSGISSHSALAKAKFLLKSDAHDSKKAGHTGTLDPMATGLLPLCFGEATKFAQYGLDADKGYLATIKLGSQTDTGDQDGQVVANKPVLPFAQSDLQAVADSLTGEQMQVPPMYSALKKDGKKLYEYARDGIEIERAARPIYITSLDLSQIDDQSMSLSVVCSKGTYVRVLGETVAERLGTLGHLTALRRCATGGFSLNQAISLDALEQLDFDARLARLLPVDALLEHLPIVLLDSDETARIKMGQRLNIKNRIGELNFKGDVCQVRLYHDGEFVGLGQVEPNGRLQPLRVVQR